MWSQLGPVRSWISLIVFFIDFSCDEFYIIVESEDAGDEQEGLCHIDQQAVRHVVDHDDLYAQGVYAQGVCPHVHTGKETTKAV